MRVIIVGAGVMGSAAAWALARRGHDVVVLDQFARGHVNGASHGASRIFRLTYPEPDYFAMARASLASWRDLESDSGRDLLTMTGGLSHGFGPRIAGAREVFEAQGIPHEWLSPREGAARFPGMTFATDVLYESETAGRLHADDAVAAFDEVAARHGARTMYECAVLGIDVDDAARTGGVVVRTTTGSLTADAVVVAAGAWTEKVLAGIVDLPPLVVTQEQPAHFGLRPGADALAEGRWPSFTHDPEAGDGWPSGTYGLATPGEGIKVGFHGVGPITDPDARTFIPEPVQLARLREYVDAWLPGLDPDDFEPVSCTYTTTPDHDFLLDRRGPVTVAAGFSGHGFKFAPVIGTVLADLVEGIIRDDRVSRAIRSAARFTLSRF